MTPHAHLAAAADILDRIRSGRAPAEGVLKDWGRQNRYAGSKDRRAIADRVYKCLRAQARLAHLMQDESGRALVIGSMALIDGLSLDAISEAFSGEGYAPSPLTDDERRRISADPGEAPAWLEAGLPGFVADRLKAVYGDQWLTEAEALMLPRAPIDLRVNGDDRDSLKQGLEMLGYKPELTPFSALGLRLPSEPPPNVRALPAFGQGRIEIQDEGSQLAGFLVGAEPGMTVVDYCAGGGGKTLAMLQAMGGQGRLIASDVEKTRLNNIRPRLKRAGLEADLRQLGPDGEGMEDLVGLADRVLVDAPCSGSGVWRRRPETAHALTEAEVLRLHALQVTILDRAARLVKPGGRLVYATCSILPDENEQSAAAFAAAHPEFTPLSLDAALAVPQISPDGARQLSTLANGGHTLRLSPAATRTDGFFVALFERNA